MHLQVVCGSPRYDVWRFNKIWILVQKARVATLLKVSIFIKFQGAKYKKFNLNFFLAEYVYYTRKNLLSKGKKRMFGSLSGLSTFLLSFLLESRST